MFVGPKHMLVGPDGRQSNRKKSKGSQQGHKIQRNDGKRLFSGFLVRFARVVERNCWMKQQSNRHVQGHLQLSKLSV